ncbi:MAG: MerR family transcriptional regulator [Alphaproteobacteria bacterium]|nr:MerR family transcriptional regulator [Alphaproteobacteria bacterium]
MTKSADAFRTISEVAEWLDTETHVLRFWESKFSQIKPVKRAGGRRYYRPKDMLIIGGIKKLLHEDGLTIKGTQRIIKDKGLNYVSNLSKPLATGEIIIEENPQIKTKTIPEPEIKSRKIEEKVSHQQTFNEVDGQFSMFSDETTTPVSKDNGPEAKFNSISDYIKNNNLEDYNRFKLENILNSINHAIKKRA